MAQKCEVRNAHRRLGAYAEKCKKRSKADHRISGTGKDRGDLSSGQPAVGSVRRGTPIQETAYHKASCGGFICVDEKDQRRERPVSGLRNDGRDQLLFKSRETVKSLFGSRECPS